MPSAFQRGMAILAMLACTLLPARPVAAAIVGTNQPARPLTRERVLALSPARQADWLDYLERSARQRRADQAFLQAELKQHQLHQTAPAPPGSGARSLPLRNPAAWYGQPEGLRIAEIVLSFQTPAGGWSKNLDLSLHRRAPGEHFAPGNTSRFAGPGDNDQPRDSSWHYVGTFDNDATVSELRFLARVTSAVETNRAAPFRAAFLRGVDYVLAAQYPNGGWPQVWPLESGYQDAITFNDGALVNILCLLRDIAGSQDEFAFVPAPVRARVAESLRRGLGLILAAQVVVNERRTAWCQQYDPLTLTPTSARNYEMPALASGESAQALVFLMDLPQPDAATIAAVHAAARWFEKTRVEHVAFANPDGAGRKLISDPEGGPLWARYYEIGSDRPIFGDRDKTIHDEVAEISRERRNGYSWYGTAPRRAIERYSSWAKMNP